MTSFHFNGHREMIITHTVEVMKVTMDVPPGQSVFDAFMQAWSEAKKFNRDVAFVHNGLKITIEQTEDSYRT